MDTSSHRRQSGFRFASPAEAVEAMGAEIHSSRLHESDSVERVPLAAAFGRVLAEPVRTDRDSPAIDVSAMDGFAVRIAEALAGELPLAGEGLEAAIGRPPVQLPAGKAVRIVTGAPAPIGADAVIKREDVEELAASVRLRLPHGALRPGMNIRRRGENAPAGATVVPAGVVVHAAVVGALAAMGAPTVAVRRRVRVRIITTGDELVEVGSAAEAWQLPDSNGPTLHALLSHRRWIDAAPARRASDDPDEIATALRAAVHEADAVFLSGGVSMGDRDFVPQVVQTLGGRVVFHKLPQRPGKPMLAAVIPRHNGLVPVMGLPGNPVSVMVTARRLGIPILAALAGARDWRDAGVRRDIAKPDTSQLDLWWHRLVREGSDGRLELIAGKGSGDVVAAASSTGFIEVPPGASGAGPWPYYAWGN